MPNQNNEVQDYKVSTGVDVINENTPTVHSKEEFSDYINNHKDKEIYQPKDLNEIKIVQAADNSDDNPENNIYEFRYSKDGVEQSLCKVIGKDNADNYFTDYVRNYFGDLKNNVSKGVAIEISKNAVVVKIKEDMQDLANDVLVEHIDDIKKDLADLRDKYKGTKQKLAKEDRIVLNKNGKLSATEELFIKLLRNKVDRDMSELAQLETKLNSKKKDLEKDRANVDAKDNIEQIWRKMHQYKEDQNHIENFIYSGSALSNFMANTPTQFERSPKDLKEAEKIKKTFERVETAKRLINQTMIVADMKKIMNDHGENLYDYLNKVASEQLDPAEQPFTVDPNHIEGFNHIVQQEPSLATIVGYNEDKDKKITDKDGKEIFVDPSKVVENKNTYTNSADYATTKEAFEKGGIKGVIDHALSKTNMSSQQREFWGGAANLAAIGGGLWLGWKFLKGTYKSIFGGEEGRKEGLPWMVGGLAAIIGSQMVTGRNARDIMSDVVKGGPTTNWAANIFGGGNKTENGKTNVEGKASKDKIAYGEGFPAMTALFNGMKYSEIQPYVLKENGKLKLNVPLMRQSKRYQTDEMAKVVDFVEKNDHKDVVDLALTGMGIDEDELKNNPDKQFNETAKDALDRVASVYKAMSDGGYDLISNEGLKMVREYIKTGSPSIDVLTGKGIFEKSDAKITATLSEPLQKAVLDMQVSDKEQLTKSIKIFLEDNKTAGLDIIKENGKTYVKNNGDKTEIDFSKKSIEHGSLTIKCDTYLELIRAATLTNFLKKELAGKSQTDKPFYESQFTGDVKFDDGVRYKPDVDAVTAGKDRGKWGINLASGKLDSFIPALAANKKTYMDYLNSFDIWKKK